MSDWLGMSVRPRTPRPEVREHVLALVRGRRGRRRWSLAAAAGFAILVVGAALWSALTIRALGTERRALAARVAALQDTLSLIRGPATRVIQIPVSTGGRVGAVTVFADSVSARWLVRCEGMAPNAPAQTYQLWFITEAGMRSAALMPMYAHDPMVMTMTLDLPADVGHVIGIAMSVEPRGGSRAPRGPMVFHVHL